MALQGDLSDLPLIDLMQVLTIQRRSGILTLVQSYSQAQIAFTQSRVYSAFVWRVTSMGREVYRDGVAALHDLIEWKDGQFTFEITNILPPVENVEVSFDSFIKDHYSLGTSQNQLEEAAAWAELCPLMVENPPQHDGIQLSMDDLRVFRLINGMLSIRDIAEMARLKVTAVIEIVKELEKRGLISIPGKTQPLLALPGTYMEYRQNREASQATLPEARGVQTLLPAPAAPAPVMPKIKKLNLEQPVEIVAPAVKPVEIISTEVKPVEIISIEAKPVEIASPEVKPVEIVAPAPKPTVPSDNVIRPATIKPGPTVKSGADLPPFNSIEAVLQAMPMGPAWMTPAKVEPKVAEMTPAKPDPQPQTAPVANMAPAWLISASAAAQGTAAASGKVELRSIFEEVEAGSSKQIEVAASASIETYNMPIEDDGPITTPGSTFGVMERFVPTPSPKPPSRLQSAPVRWDEKQAVEESLRPKVKRSLLGTIMAKIRGL